MSRVTTGSKVLQIELDGLPECQKMLRDFEPKAMANRERRALRAGAAVFRKYLRAAGSSGRYPRKFRTTKTRSHRNPLGVSVSPGSPLSPIFEHGARPHVIPIRKGPFAGANINHPGMAARPISGPVYDAHSGEAERAFSAVLFEGYR